MSRHLKVIVMALAATAAAMLLVACGGNGSSGGSGDSDESASNTSSSTIHDTVLANVEPSGKKTIGVVSLAPNNGGSARMIQAMQSKAKSTNWTVRVIDAQGDPQKVSAGIQSLISSKVNGIVVDILDPSAITPDIQAAKAAKIPFISVNSNDYDPNVATQIVANPFELGSEQATYIADKLNRKGTVALLGFTGSSNISQRQAALLGALKTYPGIEVQATHDIDVSNPVEDARSTVQSWLTKYPEGSLDAIWGAWDEPAIGAASALDASNRKDVFVTGADYSPQIKQLMQKGSTLTADWFIDYPTIGETALQAFANLFDGNQIPKHLYVRPQIITKDTLPSGDFPPSSTVYSQ